MNGVLKSLIAAFVVQLIYCALVAWYAAETGNVRVVDHAYWLFAMNNAWLCVVVEII